jgi:hypothetical protein
MASGLEPRFGRSTGLVELLDRVLDKGLVVAGDIRVSLAEVELLTIRIRLVVCSIDKAEQIGLDWWRRDQRLLGEGAPQRGLGDESLREQVGRLEAQLAELQAQSKKPSGRRRGGSKTKSNE